MKRSFGFISASKCVNYLAKRKKKIKKKALVGAIPISGEM